MINTNHLNGSASAENINRNYLCAININIIYKIFAYITPSPASGDAAGFRDLESTHAAAEKAAVADDSIRPAVRLALALQRAGFPYVCVLDEGFPKFIEELTAIAGSLEPIVLNHDPNKWEKFLISSGRLAPSRRPSLLKPIKSEIDFKNSNLEQMGMKAMTLHPPGPGDHDSKHRLGPRITVKKKDPLTELEVAQMAYLVRLTHTSYCLDLHGFQP